MTNNEFHSAESHDLVTHNGTVATENGEMPSDEEPVGRKDTLITPASSDEYFKQAA